MATGTVISRLKWSDELYVKIHDLCKLGYVDTKVAATLGCSIGRLKKWMKKNPVLKKIMEEARSNSTQHGAFADYIYKRLSPKLQRTWDRMLELEKEPNGVRRVEILLQNAGIKARQHLFLYAMVHSGFNPSEAMRAVNMTRSTLDRWVEDDPDFADLFDEIHWHKKNFFEGCLVNLVKGGDSPATIFANRTINRDRGYGDRKDVNITGSVSHQVVNLDELDLDLETRKKILEKMRMKREQEVLKIQDKRNLDSLLEDDNILEGEFEEIVTGEQE